jgi:hypothetical protein
MQLTVARWTIEYDPDATRACYARMSEELSCAVCASDENYLALREGHMPQAFWSLLDSLAITFAKPAEIGYPETWTEKSVQCGVWYHLVGRIVSGADCWKPCGADWTSYDGEEIAPGVSMGFGSKAHLVNDAFANKPIIQLDLRLEVPWVLDMLLHPSRFTL